MPFILVTLTAYFVRFTILVIADKTNECIPKEENLVKKNTSKAVGLFLLGFISALGIFGSIEFASRNPIDTFAASAETKRVWMKNSIVSTWDADEAKTYIHYWGGASNTSWPGVAAKWDAANSLVYYDIPSDITGYQFTRCSPAGAYWDAKTADLAYADSIGKYFDLTGPIAWGGSTTPGSFVSFTPLKTTIVSNFENSMNTDYSICSAPAVQTIVDNYNSMSSFEQDQFDALTLVLPNGASMNAKTRLEELRSDFGIVTSLTALETGGNSIYSSSLMTTLVLIALSSITLLAGFLILRTRKAV